MAFIESMLKEVESPAASKGEALAALGKAITVINRELQDFDPDLVKLSRSNRVERLLDKLTDMARGIALKFDAEDFTVSVGFPTGVSISFTWKME